MSNHTPINWLVATPYQRKYSPYPDKYMLIAGIVNLELSSQRNCCKPLCFLGLEHKGSSLSSIRLDPLGTNASKLDPLFFNDRVLSVQKLKATRSSHTNLFCTPKAWYNYLFFLYIIIHVDSSMFSWNKVRFVMSWTNYT